MQTFTKTGTLVLLHEILDQFFLLFHILSDPPNSPTHALWQINILCLDPELASFPFIDIPPPPFPLSPSTVFSHWLSALCEVDKGF